LGKKIFNHKRYKKDNILHLQNILKSEMFGKELLLKIKRIKKTIFYILKILIKIGNVWERILIDHKKNSKDNILHLKNI
jgi:hypothetical protein